MSTIGLHARIVSVRFIPFPYCGISDRQGLSCVVNIHQCFLALSQAEFSGIIQRECYIFMRQHLCSLSGENVEITNESHSPLCLNSRRATSTPLYLSRNKHSTAL